MFSQIVNEGTLQIMPSTTVYFKTEYLNQSTGIHNNQGELYLNNNFINHGVTTSTSGTTFFESSVNDILNIGGTKDSIQFYNLEVNVNGALKKGIYVGDDIGLIVANKLSLVSGDMRLVGESQLIQKHAGVNANTVGTGKLLRDQQGISNVYGYNFWSSPVRNDLGSFALNGGLYDGTDAHLSPFSPQQVLFNSGAPYNGVQSVLDGGANVVTPLYINDEWLHKYSPSISGYAGWIAINKDSQLNPGVGFTMKGTGMTNQNYVFKGMPNNGSFTFSLNTGESMLLGNPYPSAIDANLFLQDNLLTIENIQIWVDGDSPSHFLSDYQGGYAIYNLTGGSPPSINNTIAGLGSASGIIPKRYIGVAQGFFVEASSSGNVVFNNSHRVFKTEDGVSSNFYKTTNQKAPNNETANKYIRIGYEDPELFHRQLLLGFITCCEYPNLDFNRGYDALMVDPREDEVFFIIENDVTKKYVIQGVEAYNSLFEFPIGISITQEGNHIIMLDAVENFDDVIYIKDKLLNRTYNLSSSNFNINLPPGDYLDRFSIVFNETTLDNKDIFIENNFMVYFNNNNIFINNRYNLPLNQVKVFTELGQKIIELDTKALNQQNITIPFSHQKGLYIITLESEKGKKSFKIIN